jgi:predicted ribosome quality control (RQC) complex YloA/Tae2 family protein
MHQRLIQSIVEEFRAKSANHFLGRIFQLSPLSFAIDFGIRDSYLFISAEPSSTRFYLIRRKVKDLERQSIALSHFGQLLKAQLGGGKIINSEKDADERIVRLTFRVEDELGVVHFRRLVVQLTGRAANLFILDELNRVRGALRSPKGPGQKPGEYYLPPPRHEVKTRAEPVVIHDSPSEAADLYFQELDSTKEFDVRIAGLRTRLERVTNQKRTLLSNLEKDLANHGDPDRHKKIGDLLLANVSTAVREGNKTRINDLYSEGAPTIELEIDENLSLQEAAAQSFRNYTKAKRAREEISKRLASLNGEISSLQERLRQLDLIARERDEVALAEFDQRESKPQSQKKAKSEPRIPGVRRYLSTDGYEILVGRGARDNDNLTFRIARPNDLWLHAGDYPGSHVVIRNPGRREIPQRTVIEAAQLAGRFSQASDDTKVVIHYTERKFLSKPKGVAPGLVRMSSFRSITVEPKETLSRLDLGVR